MNDKREIIEWLYLFINREARTEEEEWKATGDNEWMRGVRKKERERKRKEAYVQSMNVYVWKWKYISKSHVKNCSALGEKMREEENPHSLEISLLSAAENVSFHC